MTVHLKIGGSTAARTLGCPAWIEKSKKVPKRPAGIAAIRGSMHHKVQEVCQKNGIKPKALIQHPLGFSYQEEGIHCQFADDDLDLSYIAYNATNALMDELDIEDVEFESFVQLVENLAGTTVDILALSQDRTHILGLDYKFGQGAVNATENAQLLFGLVAARMDPNTTDLFEKAETFTLAIIQPKISSVPLRWTCTIKELDVFETRIGEAITTVIAMEQGQEVPIGTPGKHCDWCPAAPYCTEKQVSVMAAIILDSSSHNALNVSAGMLEEVKTWAANVAEAMFLYMIKGGVIDNWKIVDKQPRNKWIDEAGAEAALRGTKLRVKDFKKTGLITAPAAIKLFKQNKIKLDLLDPFIDKVSTGTTIAPASDTRDAVVVTDVQGHLAEIMDK